MGGEGKLEGRRIEILVWMDQGEGQSQEWRWTSRWLGEWNKEWLYKGRGRGKKRGGEIV